MLYIMYLLSIYTYLLSLFRDDIVVDNNNVMTYKYINKAVRVYYNKMLAGCLYIFFI